MQHKNIFVVGLDPFHLAQLKSSRNAANYVFHPLFRHDEIRTVDYFPVKAFLQEAQQRLRAFTGPVDAIVGYWDFPVSTLLPILRRKAHLPTTSLESVLKCEHKYWSRLEQAQVLKENIPAFAAVDPFAAEPLAGVKFGFPFWLKPIKSMLSQLGFRIDDIDDGNRCIPIIRQKISRFGEPFNYLLQYARQPPAVAAVDGYHCIAESMISLGRQCTLEGYVFNGNVEVYGIIDSIREGPHRSSFFCYCYPSVLPSPVQQRMITFTRKLMEHISYDNAPFNIEFYWDEEHDQLWLLEVNPRISKSHAPLFKMVDGAYHHEVMLAVALGQAPNFPHRQGRYRCAAKFMPRRYQDATVKRVPTAADIARLQARWPELSIQVNVQEGMRLSQLRDQDSYSYQIADVFLGADSRPALLDKYRQCMAALPFKFA